MESGNAGGSGKGSTRAKAVRALAALFLLAFFARESWLGVRNDAQTSDESVTITSGYAFLKTRRVLLNPEHPMLGKALLALPLLALGPDLETRSDAWRHGEQWIASYEFLWENRVPPGDLLRGARSSALAMGLALLVLVFFAASRLYGPDAGIVALALAATSPDLLGHAHLATLDVPLTLASSAMLGAFLAFAERPTRARHLLFAVLLGVALAVKISALQLLPALGVAALVRALVDPGLAARGSVRVPRAWRSRRDAAAAGLTTGTAGTGSAETGGGRLGALYVLVGGLAVATFVAGLVLAATYLGSPRPYVMGLIQNAWLAGYGHPTYLLGRTSWTGFRSYFLVALGLKLPLVTLGTALVALLSIPFLRLGRGRARLELPALAFALTLLVLASLGPAETGVRYVFPAYPVLFVLASRLTAAPLARARLGAAFVGVLVAASLAEALAARPTYLSSMNALAGSPEQKLRSLADSNLDWGQDVGRLGAWLRARGNPPVRLSLFSNAPPEGYGIATYQSLPAAGPVLPPRNVFVGGVGGGGGGGRGEPDLVCVSANNLLGLFFDQDLYAWLRQREPVAVVGGSIWVFDLGGRAEDHRLLADTYRRAGWRRFAAHEEKIAAAAKR